jgi:hypothetical protein
MSDYRLYLSLIPEALIASMLEPHQFGSYYAVGRKSRVHGEAIFFELDPTFRGSDFPYHVADQRCIRQPNGDPKSSVYLGIYNVLARVPVSALGNLYLVTDDGRTLELKRADYLPEKNQPLHLYQEFCPITPLVVSRLGPRDFCHSITDPARPVNVPRIVFCEMELGALATDPANGNVDNLPYPAIGHLRDVLRDFDQNTKESKLFLKQVKQGVLYRTVRHGFFVGDHTDFAFYPFPSREALEAEYYDWWRSAQVTRFGS